MSTLPACRFIPCGMRAWKAGLCRKHLQQEENGQPLSEIIRDFERKFWARVDKSPEHGGCWLWTGSLNWGGYGWATFKGKRTAVHRISYELTIGPVPAGLDVDHVKKRGCRFRHCVNPDHLEPVTRRENLKRGRGVDVLRARKAAITHCPKGHPYSEHAYVSPTGSRTCRICQVERTRIWRAANAKGAA